MAAGHHFEKPENHTNSAAIWAIVTKFGVVVDMYSPQRAVTTIFDLYTNPRCRPAAILKKGKSPCLSRCFRYLYQIWCVVGHWQPAPSPCVIFGLQQNPRWRPAPFWKTENRKISTAIWDVFTNSLVKPQILFIKKLQTIYLMLYKRYKTAKIKKYKHEHYALFILATDDRLNV